MLQSLSLIAVISLFFLSGCEDQCTNFERVLNEVDRPIILNGRIKEKLRDQSFNGKNEPILKLDDGTEYRVRISDLFENADIGDSVHKDSGSLIVTITYKKSGLVDRLHPMCRGHFVE